MRMAHTRSAPGISLLVARVGSASVRVSVLEGAERGMVIRATRMTGFVPPRSARGCGTEPITLGYYIRFLTCTPIRRPCAMDLE